MKTPEPVSVDRQEVLGHADAKPSIASRAEQGVVALASPKIHLRHQERLAVVYVRQSSPQQVLNNRESRERQYGLIERAVALGWPRDRVRVVDEDQGESAASTEKRGAFQELLVEVGLDHVGLILGLEMSRMSRSCRDTYQLMEVCAVFGTLLGDFDGVYDPTDVNDRLLLGLKATISEVELHTMRSRLNLGRLNKAKRGELFTHLPAGYVRNSTGGVSLDPDEQVQSTIHLVFAKFNELKNVHAVLRSLVQTHVRLPVRPHRGPNRGQLEWHRPSQEALRRLLRHPIYAGAYCYGRSRVDPRKARPGRSNAGRKELQAEQAEVLLHNRLPAYICWDQFLENQHQMAENRSKYGKRGVPRRGAGLLVGLVVCGRCGYHLRVSYANRHHPRYVCCAGRGLYGLAPCQSLEGRTLEDLVARQVLRALEPSALELSLMAGATLEQERESRQKQWRLQLERARFETERAARQYHVVEPENRLVARELERNWEQALVAQRQMEEEHARWERTAPSQLTAEERARIEALAHSIPAIWNASETTFEDRKTIIRHLVHQVVVNVEGTSEIVQATINWLGGFQSQHQFRRRVASFAQLTDHEQLLERVASLNDAGHSHARIADQLTSDRFHPPQGGASFSASAVKNLLMQIRARRVSADVASSCSTIGTSHADTVSPAATNPANAKREPHEWWVADLAAILEMPVSTLHAWYRNGWIRGRKLRGWPDRHIYYADPPELDRLRRLRSHRHSNRNATYSAELTTPQPRVDN